MPRDKSLLCAECLCECQPWDELFSWDYGKHEEFVCEDCFDNLFNELSRHEKASLIGSEVCTAEEILCGR